MCGWLKSVLFHVVTRLPVGRNSMSLRSRMARHRPCGICLEPCGSAASLGPPLCEVFVHVPFVDVPMNNILKSHPSALGRWSQALLVVWREEGAVCAAVAAAEQRPVDARADRGRVGALSRAVGAH